MARLMDSGEALVAISTHGAGAGREGNVLHILVGERSLIDHLRRNLT